VREIVDAAGVTKPVLYYYFENKEGIFLELMHHTFSKFSAVLERVQEERGRITERLLRLADHVFALILDHIRIARIGHSIYYGPPMGAPPFDFDAFHLKLHEAIKGLVEEGMRKRELRRAKAELMVWAILGAIHIAMELCVSHPEMGMDREELSQVLNLIMQGLENRKGKGKK
jgi:AcrR family transcriptional regulator